MQLHRNVLRNDEVPQHRGARDGLAAHRGQRAALHAPAQHHDEQEVEHRARYRADDHGAQRAVRCAGRTDEVVHAHADALEHEAQRDDLDERASVLPILRRGARHAEQRIDAGGNMHEHGHDHREHERQAHRVAQATLGLHPVALAHAQRCQRITAVAHEHGDGHEHRHDGHGHRGGGKADLAHGLPQEDGVDDVVRTVDQHAQDRRDGEFHDKPRNGRRTHAADFIVAAGALRIFADRCSGTFFIEVERGVRCF